MNEKVKTFFLPGLLLFVIITRLPLIIEGTIPFMFDHGRDSVEVLHMILTKTPRLIGPRASIPGLFFGPGWYYLITPALLLGNFSPVAPVILMLLLQCIEIWLIYKYFGKLAATITACGVSFLGLATSAWNPHVMPILLLGIIIILRQMDGDRKSIHWFWLGLYTSLAFHFSSAFAVTLLISLPIIIWRRKYILHWQDIIKGTIGLIIPFVPQIFFELRHNFLEVRAILTYFLEPNKEREINFLRPLLDGLNQWGKMITPAIPWLPEVGNWVVILAGCIVLGSLLKNKAFKFFKEKNTQDIMIIIGVAYVFFSLTHFSSWYWYGTLPLIGIVLAQILHRLSPMSRNRYVYFLLLAPLLNLIFFYQTNRQQLYANPGFLPAKLKAIDWVYSRANNQPFAVYHFLPDVYDYAYQYLWMTQSFQGKQLPTDFSYRPHEMAYIPEKSSIMAKLPHQSTQSPTSIFFIVEMPFYRQYLDLWWGEQRYSHIIDQTEIVPGLMVYQALP